MPKSWTVNLYTDGASRRNPGPAAIGIVLCDENDVLLQEHKERIGDATNNEAEYRALIKGLDLALAHTRGEVHCILDSELVVRQLNDVYRVRDPRMMDLFHQVKDRERMFAKVHYRHRPRLAGRLERADALANEALDEAGY